VLDSKQFVKKTHALSSSTVNVVCAKVTATTTTTSSQDMWDRMNHVSTRRSIDNYDESSVSNENDLSSQHYSSSTEEEEEGEIVEEDQDELSSELDIMDNSSICSDNQERTQIVTSDASNLFQFQFEFGSKRPPTKPIIESDDESRESEPDQVTEVESEEEVEEEEEDYFQQESLSEEEIDEQNEQNEQVLIEQESDQEDEDDDQDSFNLSNDDEEEEWERRGSLMSQRKYPFYDINSFLWFTNQLFFFLFFSRCHDRF
jgi:hypothetical protein